MRAGVARRDGNQLFLSCEPVDGVAQELLVAETVLVGQPLIRRKGGIADDDEAALLCARSRVRRRRSADRIREIERTLRVFARITLQLLLPLERGQVGLGA